MAQPEVEAQAQDGDRSNQDDATVLATVGVGRDETLEVPQQIGEYEHRSVPNDDTATWQRIYQPREDGQLPCVAVNYAMTCSGLAKEEDDEFHVSRSVNIFSPVSGSIPNFPHGNGNEANRSRKVVAIRDVDVGIKTATEALSFAIRLMQADSKSKSLPPELSEGVREEYHKLKSGLRDD